MRKSKKIRSIEKRNSRNGFFFILPWFIGFLLFFFSPMLQSITFSFSDVKVTTSGFSQAFAGLKNYEYILYKSPEYVNNLVDSLSEFAYQIPIIMILSLIIAVIINPKFPGRTFFRSLYFVPVIIATSVAMNYLSGNSALEDMRNAGGMTQSAYMDGLIDFEAVFSMMGIPTNTTTLIFGYIDKIFDLIWQCGVHIVLFISGLQSIPEQLYEVSKVEGASKWEEFWYITIPLLGNTIILVFVYAVVEFCVNTNNKVVAQAYTVLMQQQIYGKSSAMLWLYFAVVAILVSVVFFLFYRLCYKKWQ